MTPAHAVYVCRDCPKVFTQVKTDEGGDVLGATNRANAHAEATGHTVVFHRVKMPWEVG